MSSWKHKWMRDFTCDSLLDLYVFLRENIRDLPDEQLEFLTPAECDEFRAEVLEELRKDYAFKLLTLLEADLRDDFLRSLKRRRRDVISTAYRDLCKQFRSETRQVSKPAIQACRGMRLERIFDKLRDCFLGIDQAFRGVCSVAKGYFGFRNWYAHGRIGTRPVPVVPDPEDVYLVYGQFREKVLSR